MTHEEQLTEAVTLAELLRKQLERNLQGYNNLLEFYRRDGQITVAEELVREVVADIQATLDVDSSAAAAQYRNQVLEEVAKKLEHKLEHPDLCLPNPKANDSMWEYADTIAAVMIEHIRRMKGPQ